MALQVKAADSTRQSSTEAVLDVVVANVRIETPDVAESELL